MRRTALAATVFGLLAGAALTETGMAAEAWYDRLFLLLTALVLFRLLRLSGLSGAGSLGASAALVLAGLGGLALDPSLRYTPYLMVAVINLAVALIFARGLLPGREPVLIQLVRLTGVDPSLPARFRGFMRGQCRIWAAAGGATAAVASMGVASPALRGFADLALALLLAGQAVLFVGSHWYAGRRYGRRERWQDTVAALARPATWAALRL